MIERRSAAWTIRRAPRNLLARTCLVALIIGALAGAPGSLGAQTKKKVIRLEAIKVEGRIQKPQAFYILQRSNLNFEGLNLRQSFLPKIVQSVEKEPF
ncbi:MAG: hypothetical protein HYZ27_09645 [Deltaproteobacteria bacterium]|nr:hypothetical protein [Deltaproteobacteria bacterium]